MCFGDIVDGKGGDVVGGVVVYWVEDLGFRKLWESCAFGSWDERGIWDAAVWMVS